MLLAVSLPLMKLALVDDGGSAVVDDGGSAVVAVLVVVLDELASGEVVPVLGALAVLDVSSREGW